MTELAETLEEFVACAFSISDTWGNDEIHTIFIEGYDFSELMSSSLEKKVMDLLRRVED